jgi:four helix bundle protein
MQAFQNLDVWRKAHKLTLELYRTTENFPRSEAFGLTVQVRRLSAQIPMKIAEACGHDRHSDFAQCLGQARGSGVELEYALLLSRDLELITAASYDVFQGQVIEVRRMLSGLIRSASGVSV